MKRLRLVDNWRSCWKWGSMRLNVVASAVLAYVLSEPGTFLSAFLAVPPGLRRYVGLIVGVTMFALVAFTRIYSYRNPKNDQPE